MKKKTIEKIAVRAGKGFTSFISNEGMNDIFKIIKLFDDILIDRVTEAVKHEIEKQDGGFLRVFLAPLATLLDQPVISSIAKCKNIRGVT